MRAAGFLSLVTALVRIIAPCQTHAVASITLRSDANGHVPGGHGSLC